MNKKSLVIVMITGMVAICLLAFWLLSCPKSLGIIRGKYAEPVTKVSEITVLGKKGDKIKISSTSNIEQGDLDIILYDSQRNVVKKLDRADKIETIVILQDTGEYPLTAECKEFAGSYKVKIYRMK